MVVAGSVDVLPTCAVRDEQGRLAGYDLPGLADRGKRSLQVDPFQSTMTATTDSARWRGAFGFHCRPSRPQSLSTLSNSQCRKLAAHFRIVHLPESIRPVMVKAARTNATFRLTLARPGERDPENEGRRAADLQKESRSPTAERAIVLCTLVHNPLTLPRNRQDLSKD